MLLRKLLLLPLLTLVAILNGQIADNWTFGYHAGLNFATTPPTFFLDSINNEQCVLNNSVIESSYSSNSISDCDGNLLFYTNGVIVWNKKNKLMPNYCLNDSFQGLFNDELKTKILKVINNDTLYYIFYATARWGLRFAIVNINADSGNGDIVSNHNFINNFYIGLPTRILYPPELIKHANDTDYWLVCKPTDNEIYSYLITSTGINLTPIISTASGANSKRRPIRASLSGNYIFYSDLKANLYCNACYVCSFNKSTGTVSNKKTVYSFINYPSINKDFRIQDIEFSPNDSFIYLITVEPDNSSSGRLRVSQLKRYISTPGNSPTYLFNQQSWVAGIQLAPDGKIYLSNWNTSLISCITHPDEADLACNYVYNHLDISPYTLLGSFPSVYFPLKRLKFNATSYTNTTCLTDSVRLFAQGDTSFLDYRWYFYDTTNILIDSNNYINPVVLLPTGPYKVKLRAKNPLCNSYTWWTDDIFVSYRPKVLAGIDSAMVSCGKQTVYINCTAQFADSIKINWGDGQSSSWQTVGGNMKASHNYYDSSKVYTITLTAKNANCTSIISINDTVQLQPKPIAKIKSNNATQTFPITGCTPLTINLTDSSKNADSTRQIIKNANGTNYQLPAANAGAITYQMVDTGWFNIIQYVRNTDGCLDSFVVNNAVYVSPKPTLQIQKDSTFNLCFQNSLRIKINTSFNDSTLINWGDGNTNYFLGLNNGNTVDTITHYYSTSGSYTITAKSKNIYCDTVGTITHTVRPPLQMLSAANTIICKGTTADLWALATGGDSVFSYIIRSGVYQVQNTTGLFPVAPDTTTTFFLGGISACAKDTLWKAVSVIVHSALSLSLNSIDTTICKGANYTITATANGGNGFYQYLLKKNNIIQQSNASGSFNIIATSNEIYTVVLTDNCTVFNDSLSFNIKVFLDLKFNLPIPDAYLCPGESITLKANTNNGSGAVTYQWKDGSGTILSLTDSLQITPFTSTQIILKVTDVCTSIFDTIQLYQFAVAGGTLLNSDAQSGCIPLTVNFETPNLTYSNTQPCEAIWDFGDGNTQTQNFDNTTNLVKTKHIYTIPGIYTTTVKLKFKNRATACYTFTTTIEALNIPQIQLIVTPKKITLPNTQCTVTLTTTNADSVVIDWADGYSDNFNSSVAFITQTHNYSDTGHYTIKATAYNKNTCYVEAHANTFHADTFLCFIPNAFTANKDNLNEMFKPVVSYCKSYELVIFNRWGAEVYRGNYTAGRNDMVGWNGEGQDAGTFIYMLSAKDGDNNRHNFRGSVILLR